MSFFVGFGYDIHKLAAGRKLVLGGVTIPSRIGLQGFSDADAVLHAVIDAILGAAGLGDIGEHFPDTDKRFKNISSVVLLEKVLSLLKKRKLSVGNVDTTIICSKPRMEKFKPRIRKRIAEILGLPLGRVNVKAKSSNGLGDVGKGKAIAAFAAVLLNSKH